MKSYELGAFLTESNRIEGIMMVKPQEIEAAKIFLTLPEIKIADLSQYVSATQPDAVLRDQPGLNVRVGNHYPIPGGPLVKDNLLAVLKAANDGIMTPYDVHIEYELLHPYTDGNGRSGRLLWLWQMKEAPLGFLHTFYYQAIRAAENG